MQWVKCLNLLEMNADDTRSLGILLWEKVNGLVPEYEMFREFRGNSDMTIRVSLPLVAT